MNRFPAKSILLTALILLLMLTISVEAGSAAPLAQIATNTKRPTRILTNTPRITLVPSATLVPTRTTTPTRTPTNTRTPIPTKTPTLTPSITPTQLGPLAYPDNINPLTGLPYPNAEARARRTIIVKVSNYTPVVRPQSGLNDADIVYEYEVEGGVTRFAAFYRSKGAEKVGSIRSGRLLDLELMSMYNAILAYSGSNDNIKKMILEGYCLSDKLQARPCEEGEEKFKTGLRFQALTPQFGDNCPPFCRFPRPGLAFEHTLFGNVDQMWELAQKRNNNTGTDVRGLAFAVDPDPNGKPINDIFIKWYNDQDARWQYNPQTGKYYRWNSGLPHTDAITGEQLTADNVVLLQAVHNNRPDIYESETGSPAVEIQLWGGDKAWVFRDGQWFQGVWKRNRKAGGLYLYYNDGVTPMHLKPGQTWFEVVRPEMFGVTKSETLVDTTGTETPAAATATARAPKIPILNLTQTAAAADVTLTQSAALMGNGNKAVPTSNATPAS
jgi:hypothetical protein